MSLPERVQTFVPIETVPLPRPLHRFGGAFPQILAETYVAAYTAVGATVLDPLAHPLSAADAVGRLERSGVARAPQPLAAWARAVVAAAPGAEEVLAALERVGASALTGTPHHLVMREFYGSRCATCNAPVLVEAFLWERDAAVPTKKAFRCQVCARGAPASPGDRNPSTRALLIEAASEDDETRARSVEPRGMAYWQLVERFGKDPEREAFGESVAALYTPRNLAALMATLRAIETAVPSGPARDVLLLALVEVVVAGSRLNAVAGRIAPLRIEKGRARRGPATQSREVNVWLEYERTVRDLAEWIRDDLEHGRGGAVGPGRKSADLVLFGVPADEGLGAWADVGAALCLGPSALPRAVENGDRLPARERLLRTLRAAFLDAHRGSGADALAVAYVPSADAGTLAACVLAAAGTGYRLRGILYQPDALPTAYGASAAICDFDRDATLLKDQSAAGSTAIEDAIRAGVRDAIVARGAPITTDRAAAAALESLSRARLLTPLALARAGGTSELELFFDHFRSALADGKRGGIERVGTGDDSRFDVETHGDAAPLDDRVEWGVWGLLSAGRDLETRSVLRRTYSLFRGLETPERELVERCLASYGAQGDDGRWRLREGDSLAARQAEQAALAAVLADAGHRLGFKVHIGRELRRRPLPIALASRGRVLADLMHDEDRLSPLARHLRGSADALDLVDVAWYDRGRMAFLWQIEWTARAHRAVVAIGETIPDDERLFRFVAVADERADLLRYKLGRLPALADAVRRRGWRFVKWAPLRRFAADEASGLDDLEPILGLELAEQGSQQLAFRW